MCISTQHKHQLQHPPVTTEHFSDVALASEDTYGNNDHDDNDDHDDHDDHNDDDYDHDDDHDDHDTHEDHEALHAMSKLRVFKYIKSLIVVD